MGSTGDRYTLTLRAHNVNNDQSIQNVFAYELIDGPGTAEELAGEFEGNFMPLLAAIISNATIFDDLLVINLDDPTDYHTEVLGGDGDVSGDAMPAFVAWEYEYVRATRAVNNGRKAFGLVAESSTANGNAVGPIVPDLDAVGNWLDDDITAEGSGAVWRPRIWRRPGTYASGVVPSPGEFFPISSVRFNRVSTQNTRKTGRGA